LKNSRLPRRLATRSSSRSHIDQKEQLFNIIVIICMLLFGLFVILASLWLGRRLAMPVKQLADKISGLDPAVRGARLPPGRHDATETVVITDAVNGFLQRLDGFVQREQEFTAHASHELRTPIGVIVGAADVLQTLPGLPATAKRPLARIRRASQAMTETISTLLYLARELAHADACNPPWRLDRLLPDIVEDHRHLLVRDKQLTLEIIRNEATELTAPQRVVTIAIANLLRNAVQHANAGRISVELVAGCLTIADTGRGIAAQDLIRVFERYVRGDTGESEGKGLGLYIIQQLCDRFGWAIKIDSQLAVGTRVRLDFFPQRKEAVLPGV
jgi:signal transduction histidine kinase